MNDSVRGKCNVSSMSSETQWAIIENYETGKISGILLDFLPHQHRCVGAKTSVNRQKSEVVSICNESDVSTILNEINLSTQKKDDSLVRRSKLKSNKKASVKHRRATKSFKDLQITHKEHIEQMISKDIPISKKLHPSSHKLQTNQPCFSMNDSRPLSRSPTIHTDDSREMEKSVMLSSSTSCQNKGKKYVEETGHNNNGQEVPESDETQFVEPVNVPSRQNSSTTLKLKNTEENNNELKSSVETTLESECLEVTKNNVEFLENICRVFRSHLINKTQIEVQEATEKTVIIPPKYYKPGADMIELHPKCGFFIPATIYNLIRLSHGRKIENWKLFVREVLQEIYGKKLQNYTAKGNRGGPKIDPRLYHGLFSKINESRLRDPIKKADLTRYINHSIANKRIYQRKITKNPSNDKSNEESLETSSAEIKRTESRSTKRRRIIISDESDTDGEKDANAERENQEINYVTAMEGETESDDETETDEEIDDEYSDASD